jgi:hypothetical protein
MRPAAAPEAAGGWRLWTPPGKEPARFASDADGIRVESDGGVSFLARPLTVAEQAAATLTWRWRVDAAPPPTDLARRGGDDRALALHVWFPAGRDRRSTMAATMAATLAAAAARMLGEPPPLPPDGYTLTYVWGGDRPAGTRLANPYMANAVLIVRRGSDARLGAWADEAVDLAHDFRVAFGVAPPAPPAWLAVSTDTDATGSRSAAHLDRLAFVAAGDGDGGGRAPER